MSRFRNSNTRIGVFLRDIYAFALRYVIRKKLPQGHIGKNSHIHMPSISSEGSLDNIYLGDDVNIDWNNVLYCIPGKFIMKDRSGAAVGLTVITGNHEKQAGVKYDKGDNDNLVGKDVVVEEDVWIAANVTLLAGAKIGRGAIIGAGSVVRNCKVPPYAIVIGNPAKVIGFKYTPDEIIEHEKVFYPECDRIPKEKLEKNYQKYYQNRLKEISNYVKL